MILQHSDEIPSFKRYIQFQRRLGHNVIGTLRETARRHGNGLPDGRSDINLHPSIVL